MNTAVESSFTSRSDTTQQQILDESRLQPAFPKANSLLINTGNIVSSDRLKKRTNQNSQEEINDVLSSSIAGWLNSADKTLAQESKSIQIRNSDYYSELDSSDKNDISSSVKLFLNTFDAEILNDSIKTVIEEIGLDHVDTLIISLPEKIFNQEELPKELLLPLWSVVQKYIEEKVIATAGLADFNAKYLEKFFKLLEDSNYKPAINQVNLTSCCKMPEDLVEFAKIHNVQLTTHIDPMELLTVDALQSNIRKHAHDYDAIGWVHLWLARYTLILKGRGIVKSKGYVIKAHRDLRYTK